MINESEISLLCERQASVKSLLGFQKHHKLPDKGNLLSDSFLHDIAAADIEADIDQVFVKIRKQFGLKRKQLTAAEPIEGVGEIQTPDFRYEVSVSTIPGSPDKILWRRAVSAITNADAITSESFVKVFGTQFNVLEVVASDDLEVEDVIDCVEDEEDNDISVDYEKAATWCRIDFAGAPHSVHVDAQRIQVRSSKEVTPEGLVSAFVDAHSRFLNQQD